MAGIGLPDGDPGYDLTTVVSELVANAVRHSPRVPGGEIRLVITATPSQIRVEVHDPGKGFNPHPSATQGGGLGLAIVAMLAHDWGIDSDEHTIVWCSLRLSTSGDRLR